jgi:hypothetical protein
MLSEETRSDMTNENAGLSASSDSTITVQVLEFGSQIEQLKLYLLNLQNG